MLKLSKSAQSVQDILDENNLKCKVIELPSSTRSAAEAAQSIGCDISQIVKSLIFKTNNTSKAVLILASGSNKINEETIARYIGEEISKADADFVKEITGFTIGGIPPVGHKHHINLIFIDKALLNFDTIWGAAGTPNAVFNIKVKDLINIAKGQIISIS